MIQLSASVAGGATVRLSERLAERIAAVVEAEAFQVTRSAALLAPVDTGALKASIYTVTFGFSSASEALAAASATARPGTAFTTVPGPPDRFTALSVVGVGYGVPVETGTPKRAATPFMRPAAESRRGPFGEAVRRAMAEAAT